MATDRYGPRIDQIRAEDTRRFREGLDRPRVGIRDLGDPDPSVGAFMRETIDRITEAVRKETEGLAYVAWSAGLHLHAVPVESAMLSMEIKPGPLDEDRVVIHVRQQFRVCGDEHPQEGDPGATDQQEA